MASDGTHDVLEEYTHSEIVSRELKARLQRFDLWEAFNKTLKVGQKEDFTLANNRQIRQLRNALRRRDQICNSRIIIQNAARRRPYTMDGKRDF